MGLRPSVRATTDTQELLQVLEECNHIILRGSKHLWKITLRLRQVSHALEGRLTSSGWMKELSEFCSCDTAFLLFAAIASPSPARFLVVL